MTQTGKKEATINLRVDNTQLALIDKATALQKKDRTNFILDIVYREAVNVILDRRLFLLDEDQWRALESILDAPPKALPKLAALLNEKAPWDKQ